MRYILLAILTTTSVIAFSQVSNFNSQRNWSRNKKEIMFGLGATGFLGDLGGANQVGTDYSPKDLDIPSTGYGGMIGYRYRFHPYFATSTVLNFGMIRASDAKTTEEIRNNRNLHFRSPIVNLSQRMEFLLLANEKVGKRYNIAGLKGMKNHNEQIYLFAGVGVAYFNPKAFYQGSWTPLRPLRTEGQGLAGGPDEYSNFTVTLPVGIGFRMGLGPVWRIGLEATYVKTFSDYIDDVHGVYYDANILAQEVGAASAALSNPAKNPAWFNPGSMRGDDQNDAMLYANITFYRNITYKTSSYGKRIRFGRTYRAKF